jgi:hypothetical protein
LFDGKLAISQTPSLEADGFVPQKRSGGLEGRGMWHRGISRSRPLQGVATVAEGTPLGLGTQARGLHRRMASPESGPTMTPEHGSD